MTMGAVSLAGLDAVFADRLTRWLGVCERQQLGVYIVSARRTFDKQLATYGELYPKGMRVATPGWSCHEVGAAADCASTYGYDSPQWRKAVTFLPTYSLDQPFPRLSDDPGHIEMTALCHARRARYVPTHDDGSPVEVALNGGRVFADVSPALLLGIGLAAYLAVRKKKT